MSRRRRHLSRAGIMLCLGGLGWVAASSYYLTTPLDPTGGSQVFQIARGETLGRVAGRLEAGGLVSPHAPLVLWGRLAGAERRVREGSYELSAAQSPLAILRTLVSGRGLMCRVTLPEGITQRQALDRLAEGLSIPLGDLEAAASDTAWLRQMGVPGPSLEGYVFPETYFFDRGTAARRALERMVQTGAARFDAPRRARAAQLGMTRHQVLTLASIVEAESAIPEERRRVSAVYHNRLRLGWPLQADPTVAYAVEKIGSQLSTLDLQAQSAFNTYLNAGLPPGPICSPGMVSIDAALWPLEACGDLYFVARGDGAHIFSQTLEQHNAARRLAGPG